MASGQGHPDFEPHADKASAKVKHLADFHKLVEAQDVVRQMIEVIEKDGRYPLEAYRFLQEGLEFTVSRIHGDGPAPAPTGEDEPDPNHVDGAQLCLGLRDLALVRWGRLARTVFDAWGIHNTRDFGEMVFVLVNNGFLQKTDGDELSDFDGIFPFADLETDYLIGCDRLHVSDYDYGVDQLVSFGADASIDEDVA